MRKEMNISDNIMHEIRSGSLRMKPRWFFVFGSFSMLAGLVISAFTSIFVINLIIFAITARGMMAGYRVQNIIEGFPWYLPVLAVLSLILSIFLLKKYEFSYKKNFTAIIMLFLFSVIFAALLIHLSGVNRLWQKKGLGRRIYQNLESTPSCRFKDFNQGTADCPNL